MLRPPVASRNLSPAMIAVAWRDSSSSTISFCRSVRNGCSGAPQTPWGTLSVTNIYTFPSRHPTRSKPLMQPKQDDLILITGAWRIHRRFASAILSRQGIRAHSGRRQEAIGRLVSARARRRMLVSRCQSRGELPPCYARARSRSTTWRQTWGGMGFIEKFRIECYAQHIDRRAYA